MLFLCRLLFHHAAIFLLTFPYNIVSLPQSHSKQITRISVTVSYTSGKHILNRIDILLFLFPVVSLRGLCYNILEIKMHEPITYSQ